MTTHPENDPARPLHSGPARRLNLTLGAALPPLVHHSFHSRRGHGFGRFQPVGHRLFMGKPSGGLLAYPAVTPPGVWRPWPHRTEWTDWCEAEELDDGINYHTQAKCHPRPDGLFAVVDSAADARALAVAFPLDEDPAFALAKQEMGEADSVLREAGSRGIFAHHIDFSRLREYGLSGLYLTAAGECATRLPDPDTPSLYGWDMPTVWFCEPHYVLGKPWRSRFIGDWPHLTPARARKKRDEGFRRVMDEFDACTCVTFCDEDPATACSLSGRPHTHPAFGPCPEHPDRPGDQ